MSSAISPSSLKLMEIGTTASQAEEACTKWKLKERKAREELKELHNLGKALFHVWCLSLFDKYPNLKKFAWRQFDDGDSNIDTDTPCVILNIYQDVDLEAQRDDDWCSGYADDGTMSRDDEDHEVWCGVREFLNAFDDDALLGMFGTDTFIQVTPDGVTQEEYYY